MVRINYLPKFRYHHDGKYNVMTLDGPIELYGEPYCEPR